MKKTFTLVAFLFSMALLAQHKVAEKVAELHTLNAKFTHFSILSDINEIPSEATSKTVDKATFGKINTQSVNAIATNKYSAIEIEIPYLGNTVLVELYNVDIFNANFHVDTDKSKYADYQKGAYYRGIIKGDSKSVVSFNFFSNEMNGIVSGNRFGNLVIGKLDKPGNTIDYMVYSDANMKVSSNSDCAVKEDAAPRQREKSTSRQVATEHCVTMYFEIDHDIYQANNSSVTQTTNWMTSIFNNVQTLYNNDGITVSLKSLYIWTEQDPYSGDSSYEYLSEFGAFRPVFDGDVGQLVGLDEGGLGGVAATIDGLCSQENYSYSDVFFSYNNVPVFSWTVQVITHEMGHLLGSRHTHSCAWNGNNTAIDNCAGFAIGPDAEGYECMTSPPTIPDPDVKGTIMSYCHLVDGVGISFNNGFGPQPTAAIINTIESATCLSSDCITTCINTVASISVTNVTNTSMTINWTDIGDTATSWEIKVFPYNTANSGTWTTVNTNSYIAQSLIPNTFYKVRIRPICGSGVVPFFREYLASTPGEWCNGVVIADTGGPNNNYGDMQSYVRTIIPNEPNKKITLEFTAFDLEEDYDYLTIYDGNNTSANQIASMTGSFLPPSFVSTAVDGSLTLEFSSDQAVTESGFLANVNCEEHLGVNNYKNIDFTYYPNPANGFVNISSKTEMSELSVYNITGQLLYYDKINTLDKTVDVSKFATGTYFFKLKFGDKEANFKILKN